MYLPSKGISLCFFNWLWITAFEQGYLEPWHYRNGFIISIIIVSYVRKVIEREVFIFSTTPGNVWH